MPDTAKENESYIKQERDKTGKEKGTAKNI